MTDLSIRDVAERTGLAAGTIRMWEQRYGSPRPRRLPSGYRAYDEVELEVLMRAVAYRERGLSIPAALARARETAAETDRPSIFAAVATAQRAPRTHVLRKRTLLSLSRAIEDETLAHAAAPICFGAFQKERFYRPVEHRYRRIASNADATVVFADFPRVRTEEGEPVEIPLDDDEALGNEWALIVDAPGYAATLLAWERPDGPDRSGPHEADRRFEAMWTVDPEVVRRATTVAARLAARRDASLGQRLDDLLADRPLAVESPAPALTALTNRMVGYLERP